MHSLRLLPFLCAASCLALLGACSSGTVKNTLGLTRSSPDEFRVLPRPALSVPPQFALRPPAAPGEDVGSAEVAPSKQAQALVMGEDKPANAKGETFKLKPGSADTAVQPVTVSPSATETVKGKTSAETQFLQNAGAAQADPKVRNVLTEEKLQVEQPAEESPWWDIFPDSTEKKEPIVQPSKEAERIKQNKDGNKPVTEGETPSIKPKDRGVLSTIFGD